MKLEDLKIAKDYHTKQASDLNRNLAFAGIAVVWIFVALKNQSLFIPHSLLFSLLLFVSSLFFDLMQYIFLSISWSLIYRKKEKVAKDNIKFRVSPIYANIGYVFFFIKIFLNLIAYGIMILYLIGRIFFC